MFLLLQTQPARTALLFMHAYTFYTSSNLFLSYYNKNKLELVYACIIVLNMQCRSYIYLVLVNTYFVHTVQDSILLLSYGGQASPLHVAPT